MLIREYGAHEHESLREKRSSSGHLRAARRRALWPAVWLESVGNLVFRHAFLIEIRSLGDARRGRGVRVELRLVPSEDGLAKRFEISGVLLEVTEILAARELMSRHVEAARLAPLPRL